jgi:hypothetical protein
MTLKYSIALLVLLATENASSEANAYGKVAAEGVGKKLRGSFSTTTGQYHRGEHSSTPFERPMCHVLIYNSLYL